MENQKPNYLSENSEEKVSKKQNGSILYSFFKFIIISFISTLILIAGFFGGRTVDTFQKVFTGGGMSNILDGGNNAEKITLNGEGSGRINILLLGYGGENHDGGYLTDTIMIGSIDPVNFTATALSIPRDLTINYDRSFCKSGYTGKVSGKINEIYPIMKECNRSLKKDEIEDRANKTLRNAIGNFLDININYIIKINFDGFVDGIDKIGGITVCPSSTLIDPYYPNEKTLGYEYLKITGGTDAQGKQICHKMDGKLALKYARSRYTTSDFDRAKRQQEIIISARNKVYDVKTFLSLSFIDDTLKILGDNLSMDIESINHIKKLGEIAIKIDPKTISTHVLSNAPDNFLIDDWTNGYHLYPKDRTGKEIQKFVKNIFDEPFIKKENAKILVLNGTTITGLAGQMQETLTINGYNVVALGTSEEKFTKTKLFSTNLVEKKYTKGFLETRLKTEIGETIYAEQLPLDLTLPEVFYNIDGTITNVNLEEIDFIIIVGNDFK
ncbi:MAG: hypothetical protein Fur0024_2190 [Patescibacteria group bacterium]